MHSNTDTSFTTANITVSNVIWRVWNEAYQQSLTMQWKAINTYCAHPGDALPTGDHVLAQVIALRFSE